MPEFVKYFLRMSDNEMTMFFKRVIQNSGYDSGSYADFLKSCIDEAERGIQEE